MPINWLNIARGGARAGTRRYYTRNTARFDIKNVYKKVLRSKLEAAPGNEKVANKVAVKALFESATCSEAYLKVSD